MATMNQDDLAAIVAAAIERAGTMNQDELDRMVELAKSPKRLAWQVADENKVVLPPQGEAIDLRVTHIVCHVNHGMLESVDFIANAPRTIIALVERIRGLEAQRDALEAGEWKRAEDELPPIDYRNKEPQFVYEESVEVEGLIAVPIHLCRWTYKDGTTEIVWDNKRANVRHRQVIGWKPLPKP